MKTKEQNRSISYLAGLCAGGAAATATALAVVYEHIIRLEGPTWLALLGHALLSLGLGIACGAFVYIVLRRWIVNPIQQLHVKMYAMVKGDRTPLAVNSGITEIEDILESVNYLLRRPERTGLANRAATEPVVPRLVREPERQQMQTTLQEMNHGN